MHYQPRGTPVALQRRMRSAQHEILAAILRDDRRHRFGISAKFLRIVEHRFDNNVGGHEVPSERLLIVLAPNA